MPAKYICKFSKEELEKAYLEEGRTLKEMCSFLGVQNTITASKVLRSFGIDTNANNRRSEASRNGMSHPEFKQYLETEYRSGKSIPAIAAELNITPSGLRKYFVKYGIERVDKTSYFKNTPEKNPNWRGGKRLHAGYIEVYRPEHPNANVRKCVYEHQLVMEEHIGRPLKEGEVVHHIDGCKSHNDISNLMLLTSSEHKTLHNIMRNSKRRMSGELN